MDGRRQLTLRACLLGILLSILLGAANAYIGLFAGMTVSASIPAAVVSMAIFRWLRDADVLENNIVQTAASAGEAIAAGAIFTLPALVVMEHWSDFEPVPVVVITGVGGLLGILLTIPLRRALVVEQKLPFPEGTATAAVLRAGTKETSPGAESADSAYHRSAPDASGDETSSGIRALVLGSLFGGGIKLLQSGLRLGAETVQGATTVAGSVVAVGCNLSPALFAVGVIVGRNIGSLVFGGGVLAWLVAIPIYTAWAGAPVGDPAEAAWTLWSTKIRYMGVGAMLVGGLWALWSMRRALLVALGGVSGAHAALEDLPMPVVGLLLAGLVGGMFVLYTSLLDSAALAAPLTGVMLVAAFVFSAIAAYMSGLVGSSNNPVSGVTIATILVTALGLVVFLGDDVIGPVGAILVGAVVCCAAAIGGDTMQDLKAGALLGATPWRQQVAQMAGVLSAVVVLPPILSLLLHAYGIGAPTPTHPAPLPAPQATLMAAVAEGVFGGDLPWSMVLAGALVGIAIVGGDEILRRREASFRMPVLAVAVGIYLPLELSVPIALGGLGAALGGRPTGAIGGRLLASAGLITGEALTGILLAVPIVLLGSRDALAIADAPLGPWPGITALAGLFIWLSRQEER